MASNFDFLKKIDKELFDIIEDAQKLFRDEYFNQSCVQIRIFAERTAKKVLGGISQELTFDDAINCLKDKIQSEREKEFVEDLFFIKREGNKCAHGEDTTAILNLECIKRAFEVAINYAYLKKGDEEIDKLQFDEALLVTMKKERPKIVDEYLKRAQQEVDKENLLNNKQGEFIEKVDKSQDEDGFKNKNYVSNSKQYSKENQKPSKRKKKELTPAQIKVKDKVKEAKKNLKQNINKQEKPKKPQKQRQTIKKSTSKRKKTNKKINFAFLKSLIFVIFFILTLIILLRLLILY